MSKKTTRSSASKITEFNKDLLRTIMGDVEEALRPIAEKYGLQLEPKGHSYYKESMPVMFQFLVTKTTADGTVLSTDAQAFMKYCTSFGLTTEDFGREITHRGEKYTIVGLQPRRHRFPIVIKGSNGKERLIPADSCRRLLGRGNDKPEHVKFRAGHQEQQTTLKAWLDARKGHKITAGWKEEMAVGADDFVGPLILMDETERSKDPKAGKGPGVPFGSKYLGETEWMSFTEAHRLAAAIGVTIERD